MKSILALCFLMVCASLCWGQMTGTWATAPNVSFVDNTPNCKIAGGNHNCWHLGNYTLSYISSGLGFTAGLNSSGQVLTYNDYPANAWTLQTAWGSGWSSIVVASSSLIYAIKNGTSCGQSLPDIWQLNQATNTWARWGFCGSITQYSAGIDGSLVAVRTGVNRIDAYANGVWYTLTNAQYREAEIFDSHNMIAVRTDGTMWQGDPTNWAAAVQLPTFQGALNQVAYSRTNIYALSSGTVLKYNGTSWDKLAGTGFTSLTNGGGMYVWAGGPTQSGANVYRLSDQGLQFSLTLTGKANSDGGGHVSHSNQSYIYMNVPSALHSGGNLAQNGGDPTMPLNLVSNDVVFDTFFCLESDCQPITSSNDQVWCSLMQGIVYQDLFPWGGGGGAAFIYRTDVQSKVQRIGIIEQQATGSPAVYNTSSMCNPQTGIIWQPGSLWFRKAADHGPDPQYMWGQAWCAKWNIDGAQWHCTEVGSTATSNTGYENCTTQ